MSSQLEHELEILWSETDVNTVLKAHERMRSIATKDDLPMLVDALKSESNNFWTRELISEPVAHLGGSNYLGELFDAMEKNFLEGHDNDSLAHFLTEIAGEDPVACKAKLESLLNLPSFSHRDYAEWLLEFCI